MKKWLIIISLVTGIAGFTTLTTSSLTNNLGEISQAINKSLPLLEKSSHLFLENAGTCHSCHHQALTAINLSMAKEKGFVVNDTLFQEALSSIIGRMDDWKSIFAENDDPAAIVMSEGYDLWSLSANHYKSNKKIELLVKNLMLRQTNEGCWVSPSVRPPLEYYSFSATALVLRGIQYYSPPSLQGEISLRSKKAISWLMNSIPETNEEKVFQLLGLTWAKAGQKFIRQQAKKLLTAQRDDGGWAQLNALESDAYATGQSLYALNQSGELKVDDAVYQKGISFLLKTQFDDGSWKVQSRSYPVIPFVETGFPHGKNQFISAAGTNWATMALILATKLPNRNEACEERASAISQWSIIGRKK
jgi:squalene-hopene cyclase-like protein